MISKTNKKMIFSPAPVQVGGWPKPLPEPQGASWVPFHFRAHSHKHTPSDWDKLDLSTHLTCTSLECGRKTEYWEKTHADMGGTGKLHTVA